MTTTTAPTIQTLAAEAASYFETAARDDGSTFVRTTDEAPEWVSQLVYEAHGRDFLPDDWRYRKISDALDWIADSDDPSDDAGEFADQAVDVYTGARIAWLASNLNRAGYCDEAAEEFGSSESGRDIIGQIGWGQYAEASEVYSLVLSALDDRLAEVGTDED